MFILVQNSSNIAIILFTAQPKSTQHNNVLPNPIALANPKELFGLRRHSFLFST